MTTRVFWLAYTPPSRRSFNPLRRNELQKLPRASCPPNARFTSSFLPLRRPVRSYLLCAPLGFSSARYFCPPLALSYGMRRILTLSRALRLSSTLSNLTLLKSLLNSRRLAPQPSAPQRAHRFRRMHCLRFSPARSGCKASAWGPKSPPRPPILCARCATPPPSRGWGSSP
jgi:hypothetical protein